MECNRITRDEDGYLFTTVYDPRDMDNLTENTQSLATDMPYESNYVEKPPVEDIQQKIRDYASIEKASCAQSEEFEDDAHSLHGFVGADMKPTTYVETFTHMLKGNIGCGMLAMGMAYKNGGLLFSTVLILIIGVISTYNQYTLVQMANEFQTQYKCGRMSFSRTIHFAFKKGSPMFQNSANFTRFTIEMFIILTQLGFCCVYFVFIASSLKQIFDNYELPINELSLFMTLVLPVFWITSLIRELKYIAPLSTLANLSVLASLALITICNVQNLPPIEGRSLIGRWEDIPLCFGTVVYALEGISLVLPLQQNMKDKRKFLGAFGVLNVSIGVVVFLMISIGFFGYYKNGDEVKASLTFNLDIKNVITQVIIGSMVLGMLCTYALQFFIPVMLLLPWVHKHTSTWPLASAHLYEYVLRSVLVLLTYFVARNVPHFDLFVSLIGAIGSSFLALIYTPLADLAITKDRRGTYRSWRVLIAIISLLIGVVGFFVGTSVSLREIVIAVQNDRSKRLSR